MPVNNGVDNFEENKYKPMVNFDSALLAGVQDHSDSDENFSDAVEIVYDESHIAGVDTHFDITQVNHMNQQLTNNNDPSQVNSNNKMQIVQ